MTNPNPLVARAGKARDLLVAAGMGDQVRIITFDASKFAGSDDVAYLRYVQQKIDERKTAKETRARLLRYFDELSPFAQKMVADLIQDMVEITEDGGNSADVARYIRRNYW